MNNLRSESRGFSLIEVIVTAGVLGIIALGSGTMLASQFRDLNRLKATEGRNLLFIELTNTIRQSGSLIESAAGSTELSDCLHGTGTCHSVTLLGELMDHNLILQNSLGVAVGGISGSPVGYTQNGQLCSLPENASEPCVFDVVSWFNADCAGLQVCPSGQSARRLRLNFSISERKNASSTTSLSTNVSSSSYDYQVPLLGPSSGAPNTIPLGIDPAPLAQSLITQSTATEDGSVIIPTSLTAFGKVELDTLDAKIPVTFGDDVSVGSSPVIAALVVLNGNTVVHGDTWAEHVWASYGGFFPTPTGSVQSANYTANGPLISHSMVTATTIQYSSDLRLKRDIATLISVEEKLRALRGVHFNWKENGKADYGFIAQDVERVFPELVQTDDKGFKSVEYGNLIPVVVSAFKSESAAQIKLQLMNEARARDLDNRLKSLRGATEAKNVGRGDH